MALKVYNGTDWVIPTLEDDGQLDVAGRELAHYATTSEFAIAGDADAGQLGGAQITFTMPTRPIYVAADLGALQLNVDPEVDDDLTVAFELRTGTTARARRQVRVTSDAPQALVGSLRFRLAPTDAQVDAGDEVTVTIHQEVVDSANEDATSTLNAAEQKIQILLTAVQV